MTEKLLNEPPAQPTMPELIAEPLNGPETVVELEPPRDQVEPALERQPSLIPMTDDEVREAGHKLAVMIYRRERLKADHAAKTADMRKERDELDKQIEAVAQTIREQGR